MRFYELNMYAPGASKPSRTWTTHPNGVWDPGALMLGFDVIATPYATPVGGSTLTLWGVSLQDLAQSSNFGRHYDAQGNYQPGVTLELLGGMAKGLPLADPTQRGLLMVGEVVQGFGNWQGTDQHISLVIYPSVYTMEHPGNFVLVWRRGQKLSEALESCLKMAYPNNPVEVSISDQIIADQDMPHVCGTLSGLAMAIKDTSEEVLGPRHWVDIAIRGRTIVAYDGTVQPGVVQLNIPDLLSQPTWVDVGTMQIDVVLRGDVQVGGLVRMPPALTNSPGMVGMTSNAWPGVYNYQATFSGDFKVTGVRHVGNSRSPDGTQWATHLRCVPNTPLKRAGG
ncbi:MAG: hypothetical protein EPN31_14035 [Castellaniella sp.]|uniref:hypothetical protein n=1 Tax=Castellaniella sp. TaxID=1955812 RepID=UPI001214D2F4|nr:hypothetical protein [Castellaniella sp.]TAN26035.1 MAG: hypothetical protein EPN31_14035 [Castellaniella sp.]